MWQLATLQKKKKKKPSTHIQTLHGVFIIHIDWIGSLYILDVSEKDKF